MAAHLLNGTMHAAIFIAALTSACAPPPGVSSPSGPATAMAPTSAPAPTNSPRPGSAAPRCPVVPLRLVVRAPGQQPMRMLTLGIDGSVEVTTMGGPPVVAQLDPRGCLVGPDGLWAELTPAGKLWTAHEVIDTDGPAIRLPEGAALRITPNDMVERVEKNGAVEPNAYGTIQLEGYREDATCAAVLLLGAFLSMMPSMAVVDGHPAMAPAPDGSLCNEFRHPKEPAAGPEPFPEPWNELPPPGASASSGDPPRVVGCPQSGAVAASPNPTRSGNPPTMKGAALGCAFPSGKQAAGIDGACVTLAVRVGMDGNVTEVKVVHDPGYGFGDAAKACIVSRAKFGPGTDAAGHPVEAVVQVNVRFAR